MTSTVAIKSIDFTPVDEISSYFRGRAAKVDRSEIGLYEGLKFLFGSAPNITKQLSNIGDAEKSRLLTKEVSDAIASVAYEDMASAFAAWCHRMVLEYVYQSDNSNEKLRNLLIDLKECQIFGSTAMGPGTANFLAGSEIPVKAKEGPGGLTANGKIRWASNLTGNFVIVTAVQGNVSGHPYIVTIPGDSKSVSINKFSRLLGLDQTFSTSIDISNLGISEEDVITKNFSDFMRSIIVPFLILQSSFCKGLAARSLYESSTLLNGPKQVFYEELEGHINTFNHLAAELLIKMNGDLATDEEINKLLQVRLNFALLASASVNLEYKLCGGSAYSISSPVSRRLREAAFLPIQAPTEVQLRWILSQSN